MTAWMRTLERLFARREADPPVEEMMNRIKAQSVAFDAEAKFTAHCCQILFSRVFSEWPHHHDAGKYRRTACWFRAPWNIADATGLGDDGPLAIRCSHPLVNWYNKAMAVGLRHNHDVSMFLTRTKGLAMVFYITNYATKLGMPMWRRIAHMPDVFRQLREDGVSRRDCRPFSMPTVVAAGS